MGRRGSLSAVWLAWGLLVAAQVSNEAVGQITWPSPFGYAEGWYGERVVFTLACLGQVVFVHANGPRRDWDWFLCSAWPGITLLAALVLSPIPTRGLFPPMMAFAQFAMASQLMAWTNRARAGRVRLGRLIVCGMQCVAFVLFAYAQLRIGLTPVGPSDPVGAIDYLHGPLADLLPAIIGTALLAWASLRRG